MILPKNKLFIAVMADQRTPYFIPLKLAARRLGVPLAWLRDEIESGRLPGLKAGRAILVHVPTVAKQLTERAKAGEEVIDGE